jgi:N-acetylgalactosamine-6-sulfatase
MTALEKEQKSSKSGRNDVAIRMNLMGCNGAFRGGKHTMHEGGVRSPFILRWPGRVPAGRVDQQSVIGGIDWLPTLCGITGITIDDVDFDGENVVAAWLGGVHARTKLLYWKTNADGSPAGLRDGRWKLMMADRRRSELQLYDLAVDAEERHNVAGEHPDVVRDLTAKAAAWTDTLPKHYVKSKDKGD